MAKVTYDADICNVLIARTAKRAGVIVVTDNVNDFKKIRNFCDVTVISGSKYFSSRVIDGQD